MQDKKLKYAACVLIVNDDGQVVLTTRRNSTVVGLPGGKLDLNETALDAVIRETFEETGLKLEAENLLEVYTAVCVGEVDYETTCFITTMNCLIPGGTEKGIDSYWGNAEELIENSPFKEYNKQMFQACAEII